jgi:zinc transport system substrate-binding protein
MPRAALLAIALSASAAAADVPAVVTDIPPVHSLAASVMGTLGQPTLLLGQGADAHDYQMRPSDARALADADAVFWIGPEMTPWLGRALQDGGAARATALLDTAGTHLRSFDDAAEAHHDDEGHDHDDLDPHAFLDPANAMLWLTVIADRLAALDPANADAYRANAAAEAARIAALDADIAARLGPVADRPVIVFHEALGYFAHHYALTVIGSVALGDAADPGAAHLSDIRAALSEAVCIFPEAGHDPQLIISLTEGTPARLGRPLDPEGRSLEPGPALYTALLGALADSIATCLSDG